jgi:hypothetical protein
MPARKPAGKETRTEALVRETVQEVGSVVAPSLLASPVLCYLKKPNDSRYRVCIDWRGGFPEWVEMSATQLKQLLREDIAEEALA